MKTVTKSLEEFFNEPMTYEFLDKNEKYAVVEVVSNIGVYNVKTKEKLSLGFLLGKRIWAVGIKEHGIRLVLEEK